MTLSDFEDPTELARCARSDCNRYRLGNDTPLCAQHLREQEATSAGYTEPDLEARLTHIRTEDDDHPGHIKIYDRETGEPSWIPADKNDPRLARPNPTQQPPELYVGPDPDLIDPKEFPQEIVSTQPQTATDGCWITYHPDWSEFALFTDETQALRHAVANHMNIGRATWGQQLGNGQTP